MNLPREPIRGAAAWLGSDFRSKADFTLAFTPEQLAEIDQAVRACSARGLNLSTVSRADFPLPHTAPLLAQTFDELKQGRGIVILRGIDPARYTLEQLEMIYWGLGTYLGEGVSQSVLGDRLGHVKDTTATDPHARAYRNKQELTPHTDRADIVGLMCVRSARSGGVSLATSSLAVHNELAARYPQYLQPLHDGFFYHRRGEQAPGEAPVTAHRIPVYAWLDQQLSCHYVRSYIESAPKDGAPPLTELQRQALDTLERLTYELAFQFVLDPGEIYLINNYTVLHARTAFEDHAEPERKRLLLRLWLNAPGFRALPDSMAGMRAGIAAQQGKLPSYAGFATASRRVAA